LRRLVTAWALGDGMANARGPWKRAHRGVTCTGANLVPYVRIALNRRSTNETRAQTDVSPRLAAPGVYYLTHAPAEATRLASPPPMRVYVISDAPV
jgi:hypothetical protein